MGVSSKQVQNMLRSGGQRVFQQGEAELYDRRGPHSDRQTGAGMKTKVHQLLDRRLDVTDNQRAVGNCYGAFYEQAMSGGGSEFLREHVDTSSTGGGGYSEAKAHKVLMVGCAAKALAGAKPFKYPRGKSRSSHSILGRHNQIKPLTLAQIVCVGQQTLSHVALTYGWTRIPIKNGKWGRPTVPDRQRKALAAALRTTLDTIADAWAENGYSVPYEFGTVEVR